MDELAFSNLNLLGQNLTTDQAIQLLIEFNKVSRSIDRFETVKVHFSKKTCSI